MMAGSTADTRTARPPAFASLGDVYQTAYYSDCFVRTMTDQSDTCAMTLYRHMTRRAPAWINRLLGARDAMVSLLNMTPTHGFQRVEGSNDANLKPGDSLDFFEVVINEPQELVLKHKDRHFFVSLSLYVQKHDSSQQLYVTSVVTPYSRIGKLYITLIAPFHRKIVRTMLNSLA